MPLGFDVNSDRAMTIHAHHRLIPVGMGLQTVIKNKNDLDFITSSEICA